MEWKGSDDDDDNDDNDDNDDGDDDDHDEDDEAPDDVLERKNPSQILCGVARTLGIG